MEKKLKILEEYKSGDYQKRHDMFFRYPGFRNRFIRFEMNNRDQSQSSKSIIRKINLHLLLKMGSAVIGITSLIMFMIFMIIGTKFSIALDLSQEFEILFDIFLCMLFFFQHSLMTRPWFKLALYKVIPQYLYPLLFSLISGATLLITIIFWQGQTMEFFVLPGWMKIISGVISVLCVYGLYRSTVSLKGFDPFGLRTSRPKPQKVIFKQKGPYKWVRHPLYLFSIIFIWSTTIFTYDRIIFNILWTTWIIAGTWLEDRDITDAYPKEYGEYKKQVPMIIPGKFFSYNKPCRNNISS